jgi:acyl-CoA dehydrogenase
MIRDQETLQLLQDSVRRFVREVLVPHEETVAEQDAIPEAVVGQMRELGLFGLAIPEEYGGLGLTMEEEVLVAIELAHASPAFRSLVGTNNGIGAQGILIDGTPQQKAAWLPRLASGEVIGSFALTEPDSGSDAASLRTTAVRDGDAYIINGTKRYITNAPEAGVFTVMARTDPSRKEAGAISAILVERGAPGLTLGKIDRKMGQRGAHTAMKVLDKGRLHIAAVCVGAAERMLDDALAYALERKQFGQPIAEFQLVQAMLADSRTEIYAARSMVLDAARRRDAGEDVSMEASCCKLFASEMCGRVADRAVQIHGGAGYVADYAAERFYRDVRLFRIYEGTSQIQQLVIARHMIRKARA